MKLIIIDHEPYRSIKKQYFYIDEFIIDGFDVEYWSIWRALNYSKKLSYSIEERDTNVTYFDDQKKLINTILNLPKGTFICAEFWQNWDTAQLLKTIHKNQFKVFSINQFHNISTIYTQKLSLQRLKALNFSKIMERLKLFSFNFYISINKIKPISLVFLTGSKIDPIFKDVKAESISYMDVELYEKIKHGPRLIEEKYIVFLDTWIPSHPDGYRMGKTSISPELYYSKMNRAFDKIEQQTNCKVIIAAHPKAKYTNEFGNRTLLSGKTAELVAHCEMVLDSLSLSVNYAVQAKKKIFMVYLDEFKCSTNFLHSLYQGIENMSDVLKCEALNLDENFNLSMYDNINLNAYKDFGEKYLYSIHYPKPNFEIIKNAISNI